MMVISGRRRGDQPGVPWATVHRRQLSFDVEVAISVDACCPLVRVFDGGDADPVHEREIGLTIAATQVVATPVKKPAARAHKFCRLLP
jgi:hypothetical protein